jgi:hypothetical protein
MLGNGYCFRGATGYSQANFLSTEFRTADCQVTRELGDTTKSFLKTPSLCNDKVAQNMSYFAEARTHF